MIIEITILFLLACIFLMVVKTALEVQLIKTYMEDGNE